MAEPHAFRTPQAFRRWLEKNHAASDELYVCCFKVHAAERGVTYAQALDEALCFGWIDGVRKSLGADSFSVRFTPRKRGSKWSAVNLRHIERLRAAGRMHAAGEAVFEARDPKKAGYSYEDRPQKLPPAYLKQLRANARAATHFDAQAPWYQRACAHWILSAKQQATRERRLAELIACSAAGKPVPPLRPRRAQ
jgi:uncharacterized protein YdeI (YjbR/CyaY-like superfamily)